MNAQPDVLPGADSKSSHAHAAGSATPRKLVLFYEDFDAAIRLRRAFDELVQRIGPNRPIDSSSWSFSMLGQREFNASVLMETVQADTIVISASGHDPLPERVASWLELCMTREGRNAPPQIIVLHENGIETDSATLPLCASLKRIATRSGAGFMCLMDSAAPAADEARNRIAKRWAGISEPVAEPGRYPVAEVSRRWGIND